MRWPVIEDPHGWRAGTSSFPGRRTVSRGPLRWLMDDPATAAAVRAGTGVTPGRVLVGHQPATHAAAGTPFVAPEAAGGRRSLGRRDLVAC